MNVTRGSGQFAMSDSSAREFVMRSMLLFAVCLLAACSSPRFGESPQTEMVASGELPTPSLADFQLAVRPNILGPFDKLSIDVFGVEDLNREVQIDGSGIISFPLVGAVSANGLTTIELAQQIEQGLTGRFVRNPQVTVNLMESVSQVITVDGEVREPGLYPAFGNMTLIRAVASAGGTTDLSAQQNVVVFRVVNGQRLAALYNLKAIRQGNYEDPRMYPNDIVVVSESTARRIFRDVLTAAPLLTTPIIAIANNN